MKEKLKKFWEWNKEGARVYKKQMFDDLPLLFKIIGILVLSVYGLLLFFALFDFIIDILGIFTLCILVYAMIFGAKIKVKLDDPIKKTKDIYEAIRKKKTE